MDALLKRKQEDMKKLEQREISALQLSDQVKVR